MLSSLVLVSSLAAVFAAPLKVIIMAGQSNMQGHGYVDHHNKKVPASHPGTLEQLVKSNPTEYGKLKNGNNWVSRKDVWVYYNDKGGFNGGAEGEWSGELTVGFAGDGGRGEKAGSMEMGPELGFGWALGDVLDEQVLLLKTAWGGKDIDVDYRPPSVGGTTGWFYKQMIQTVRSTLKKLPTLFPSYSGSYELAGFAWHQGWNDACGVVGGAPDTKGCKTKHHCRKPDPTKYEEDLAALIKDLRKEFSDLPGGAKLPVSIGTSGMRCGRSENAVNISDPELDGIDVSDVNSNLDKYIVPAQLAVGNAKKHPEFAGNVLTADTSSFLRSPEQSPGKQCYHWNNNCESYWLVGQAMGKNMAKLIHDSTLVV
jgi:alpha-galactosidase